MVTRLVGRVVHKGAKPLVSAKLHHKGAANAVLRLQPLLDDERDAEQEGAEDAVQQQQVLDVVAAHEHRDRSVALLAHRGL